MIVDHSQALPYGWLDFTPSYSHSYVNPALLKILRAENPSRVLDLGCGNGFLCEILRAKGFDVVGMEPDADGVRLARQHCNSTTFYQLGVDDDPALILEKEGLFDAIVSTEVVEHLYSPHMLPRFSWRLLKPGGILVVTTPYHGYLKNLALSIFGKWDHHHMPLSQGGHIKFFSRATLARLLQEEGFLVDKFIGVGRLPFLWNSMILTMRKPLMIDKDHSC